MSYLALGIAYVVLYVAIGWALSGDHLALSIFGNAGLLLPPLAVCALVLYRRRSWRGCQRLFWDTVAIGLALWIVGHLGWAWTEFASGRPTWLQWHTLFSLIGGTLPLIALLALPHRGPRPDAASRVAIDLASYTLLAAFVYTDFVMIPSLTAGGTAARDALLILAQINRVLLLFATVALAWASRHSAWGAVYSRLAIGAGIGFFVRIVTSAAIARGDYHVGSFYDVAWIAPWLAVAWAAVTAPPSETPVVELPAAASPVLGSAVPVLLIPVLGYGALQFQSLGSAADSFRVLLTSLLTVAGLGLLTLRLRSQGDELQRADARLKLLAAATEQTGDLITIIRVDGRYEHANEAFVRAVGYSREEIAGLVLTDLIERGFEQLGERISADVREHGVWRGTILRRRRDGTTFPASCTVVALKDAGGEMTHFVGVERDMTEELKLRDQLVQSERMSAVGELVAGVAHEINNPLQTIVGCVDLMLDEHRDAGLRRDLELMRREAARAGQIIRNLLSFVRRSAPDRVVTDLNEIVEATVALREYHLHQNNVELMLHCDPGPLQALVNREEIQQIVVNLLLNAEQAIARGAGRGTITIETSTSGRHHLIEVADDGPGIRPELRGRIFEPFFTTKQVGEGTGLGLSISHGIASAHGGTLELLPGRSGARFRLMLPAHAEAGVARPLQPRGASGRALVVDDELPIRTLLVRLLERRGFHVIAADNGDTALTAAASAAPLSLVISDLRMPGSDGFDLYRRLMAIDPSLATRYIFMSGDSTAADTAGLGALGAPVIRKPFTAADLDALLARLGIQAVADRRSPL